MAIKLQEYLTAEQIIPQLDETGKDGVLDAIASNLAPLGNLPVDEVAKALKGRESLSSTGIGGGVAIPHAKFPNLEKVMVGFARSKTGVDYRSIDGAPVQIFFTILSPSNKTAIHLKVLARLATLLRRQSFKDKLLACANASDIFEAIIAEDSRS